MSKISKLLFVLAIIFMFSTPSSAYVWNPNDWIIHDDVAAEEAAEELLSRQETIKGEDGVFRPFANMPTYPFGGTQNISATAWPVSMRKAMEGPNGMPQDVKDWFKTPAFDYGPGKHSVSEDIPGNVGYFTSQQEMIDWFEALPKDRMKFQLITGFPYFTGNGPNDYALARTFELIFSVFSKPSVFTPEEVKALGKPVVWLHAQIHGRESSPGEALLQLAKEFAEGKHDSILDKVTVIIVPRFNVDGAWNAQRTTTGAAPIGHAGLGSAGIDMNRDFVAFETPLVRAVRQLQIAYDPIVSYCGHEQGYTVDTEYVQTETGVVTNGFTRGYDVVLATSMTYNLNVDKRVRDLGYYLYEPATKKVLEDSKVGWNRYVGGSVSAAMGHGTFPATTISLDVVSRDGIAGPLPGRIQFTTAQTDFALVPEEGIGINGTALGNQSLVFVYEASAVGGNNTTIRLAYLRRVYAQYLGALEICRTAANNVDRIMTEINAARTTEISRTQPLSFWGIAPAPQDYTKNVFEYKSWKKEDTSEVVDAIGAGTRPIKWILAHFADRDPNASVMRPIAYIIPKDHYEAAMRLFYSGVKLERLTSDQTVEVEAYTVRTTGNNNLSPSGSTSQVGSAIRSVTKATITKTFPKDSFVVRMNQLGASLAGLALEPMAIRNFGNMYLSRAQGASGNAAQIPAWYRDTFLPVSIDAEYPSYRYVNSASNPISTYSANMNLPVMLTMVEKVHAFTQEEVADIKEELGLEFDPDYLSKFQLPVLSTDAYKNMANVLLNEAFVLPGGEIVKIDPEYVLDGNIVKIVAPKGLDGNTIFAEKKDGSFGEIFQKELDPVKPEDVLVGGKAPDGAQIQANKLVWTTPFKTKGVILSNSMLDGYRIAGFEPVAPGVGYTIEINGDEVIARFTRIALVDGTAKIYLVEEGSAGVDQILIVEFKGSRAEEDFEPVAPEVVLIGGKAPEGARIESKKLVWTGIFVDEGIILSNSMLNGYKIAYVSPVTAGASYSLDFDGEKVIARFNARYIVNGTAEIYLVNNGSTTDDVDQLLIVEFRGRKSIFGGGGDDDDDEEAKGCNAVQPLVILLALIPLMASRKK